MPQRHGAVRREEEAQKKLRGLADQVRKLENANGTLRGQADLLSSLSSVSRIAMGFYTLLGRDEKHGPLEGVLADFTDVEQQLGVADAWDASLKPWIPQQQAPGIMNDLISVFVNGASISGPAATSLLSGQPMSLMLSALICMCSDPQLRGSCMQLVRDGPAAGYEAIQSAREELLVLVHSFSSHPTPLGPVMLAARVLAFHTLALCTSLFGRVFVFEDAISLEPSDSTAGFLEGSHPLALFDQVTEQMALTPKQVAAIIQAVAVIDKLQEPLLKKKAAAMSRVAHLLSPKQHACRKALPLSGVDPAMVAAAAAVIGSSTWGNPGLAGGDATAAPDFLTCNTFLELESLGAHLTALESRLFWLDLCCAYYAAGQLSWWQQAYFILATYPSQPSLLFWTRRLVTRASLPTPRRAVGSALWLSGSASAAAKMTSEKQRSYGSEMSDQQTLAEAGENVERALLNMRS